MTRQQRIEALFHALEQRILVLDGAMGTALQDLKLSAEDFGGPEQEGCNEALNLTRPDVVAAIHAGYLGAGADIVETNTFGGTPLVLGEYGIADRAEAINAAGARLARAEADKYSTPQRPRWVAGSLGPTTRALSLNDSLRFEELVEHYLAQARALHAGGVDYFLIETAQDICNVKAATRALDRLFAEGAERLPVAVSVTVEASGTLLAGQAIEAVVVSLEHLDLLYLGLNCATGPAFMTDHLRALARLARTRVACVPNAGLPDEDGRYLETPEMLARVLERFGREGWLNLMGGCCGTHPGHIRALAELAPRLRPRPVPRGRRSALSGIEALEINDENRPIIVGERCNVLGSKRFRELIAAERFEEAAEIGRNQVKRGAHLLDVSTQQTDRDEIADLTRLVARLVRAVRVPLMLDSTNPAAIEAALQLIQGKAIVNSVNLEDGEKRFQAIAPLARQYGAALVVGTIDERGQAINASHKIAIARRSVDLLTGRYGIAPEDLYIDPLVFPAGSGDAAYAGSAAETLAAVAAIKRELPRCRTVLGISNVSFGLPPAGREVVNAVFLHHAVQAGLDMAIVNSEKLERFASLSQRERELAEAVLFCRGPGSTAQERLGHALAAFVEHFRTRPPQRAPIQSLPLDERLARHVIEGSKERLIDDLEEKLASTPPLDIINGPLMRGMDEVGRLFNQNQLIVAEVLQSAEVMKAAVAFLERFLEPAQTARRGKIILATVKGDVHDIGKNLVEIVLGNNGFQVVNLGIKVPPERLVKAIQEEKPDLVGLSGLLVKSAHQMAVTAQDLRGAGIDVPLLVGGAALTRGFVDRHIAPVYGGTVEYAPDAMAGLELAKQLVDPVHRRALDAALAERRQRLPAQGRPTALPAAARRAAVVPEPASIPQPPDFDRHVLTSIPLDQIWSFVNPVMLYGRHLGVKGPALRSVETASRADLARTEAGRKALRVREAVGKLKALCRAEGLMRPRAVYRFYEACSEGESVLLFEKGASSPAARLTFLRQPREGGLCLADYVARNARDNVALFVTTAGEGVRESAERLKQQGEYLTSHILQALALETAEAYAELLHSMLRSMWGFPDPPEMTMLERFKASYRGKRYSFGYPACPRLEDQQILFQLLRPEEIGVTLTDGFMMDPEASVSALVLHHPQATYFSVGEG